MGLFNKLGGGKDFSQISPKSAMLMAAITMVAADGDIDDDELAIIHRLDGKRATRDFDDALKAWKKLSIDECVNLSAEIMNLEQQTMTMANLIDIAMADGILDGSEEELLEKYVEAFSVPQSEIEKMVEVIGIKNKPM